MPSLKEYIKRKGSLPASITASFAFYIAFFNGHTLTEDGLDRESIRRMIGTAHDAGMAVMAH